MVVRTFPIRVAGNSGPMRNEISWLILAGEINAKRRRAGLPLIVREESLEVWTEALEVAAVGFGFPRNRGPHDQHMWTAQERKDFDTTLSGLNAAAWKLLPESIATDLLNLFELTTVTKKLRRIARFDTIEFGTAFRQVRPKHIAMTFGNYVEPDCWYKVPNDGRSVNLIGTPVGLASYGPESSHILDLRP